MAPWKLAWDGCALELQAVVLATMREKGDSDDGGTGEGIVRQRNGPRWSRMSALIKVDLPSRRALPSKSIPHPWLAGCRYVAACQNCIWYSLVLQPQVYRQQWRHRMGDSKDRGQGGPSHAGGVTHITKRHLPRRCVVGGEEDRRSQCHPIPCTCLRVHLSS